MIYVSPRLLLLRVVYDLGRGAFFANPAITHEYDAVTYRSGKFNIMCDEHYGHVILKGSQYVEDLTS